MHMLSDAMHDGLFQHRGGQAPAGEVLLATVLDEALGDVVAEPLPGFLFVWLGVSRSLVSSKSLPASGKRLCRAWRPWPLARTSRSPRGHAVRRPMWSLQPPLTLAILFSGRV